MINFAGLDRAAVLAALYNASRPQGMGFLQYEEKAMTVDEARALLGAEKHILSGAVRPRFDYLKGRVMKLNLGNPDTFDERLYDRDNGDGAAARVINALRATQDPMNDETVAMHRDGRAEAKADVERRLDVETTTSPGAIHLGLDDVKESLKKTLNKLP